MKGRASSGDRKKLREKESLYQGLSKKVWTSHVLFKETCDSYVSDARGKAQLQVEVWFRSSTSDPAFTKDFS